MMRLPEFEFRLPGTVADAATLLAERPESTRLVAGGTDLWPNMKRRHQRADVIVSLRKVKDLHGVSGTPQEGLRIGAMTTLTQVARHELVHKHYPILSRAILSISSPVLRNMGTLGGNLCLDTRCTYYNQNEEWRASIDYCMKEAGQTCWVAPSSQRCWAISASDSAPLLCAEGAEVELVSHEGTRRIPLTDLYQDDGIAYLTKRRDEILTAVYLKPAATRQSSFWKLRRRGSIDFSVLSVAPALELDNTGSRARCEPAPRRRRVLPRSLRGRRRETTRPGTHARSHRRRGEGRPPRLEPTRQHGLHTSVALEDGRALHRGRAARDRGLAARTPESATLDAGYDAREAFRRCPGAESARRENVNIPPARRKAGRIPARRPQRPRFAWRRYP